MTSMENEIKETISEEDREIEITRDDGTVVRLKILFTFRNEERELRIPEGRRRG